MPKGDKLTMKQQAFVDAYVIHGNATQAAREAGYSGTPRALQVMGADNLSKPIIRREILAIQQRNSVNTVVTQETVIRDAMKIYSLATDDAQYSPAIAALQLAGKAAGVLIDRSESKNISINAGDFEALRALSLPELRALLSGAPEEAEPSVLSEGDSG